MFKSMLLVSATVSLAFAAWAAQAMPLSSTAAGASSPPVVLVAGGCGIGFHPTAWGCRRNMGPGPVVVPVPGPGPLPYWQGPGWRFYNGCWRGPYGRVHCV
jgi:hypothetical protein